MKKRVIAVLMAAAMAATLLAGCGNKSKDTAGDGKDVSLEYVKDKGSLVIGLDPAFPPMGFADENQEIVGFDIDLAKEVCKRVGVEPEFTPIDWDTKEQELNTKGIDCIWNGLSRSPEREEELLLSDTYMLNTQVAVVLAENEAKTLSDLAGKTVAVQTASTAEEAIAADKEFADSIEVLSIKDNVQAMLELGTNSADAVVMDKVVAMYYMEKEAGKYKILEESLADEEYAIAFRKSDKALCDEVVKMLKEMKEDGTLAEIATKWFGEDITTIK